MRYHGSLLSPLQSSCRFYYKFFRNTFLAKSRMRSRHCLDIYHIRTLNSPDSNGGLVGRHVLVRCEAIREAIAIPTNEEECWGMMTPAPQVRYPQGCDLPPHKVVHADRKKCPQFPCCNVDNLRRARLVALSKILFLVTKLSTGGREADSMVCSKSCG